MTTTTYQRTYINRKATTQQTVMATGWSRNCWKARHDARTTIAVMKSGKRIAIWLYHTAPPHFR